MYKGSYQPTEEGTPQGGNISSILANIYLDRIVDKWFDEEIKPKCKSYISLIRYADDFVICCQSEVVAKIVLERLEKRLLSANLEVSKDKTRIIEFGRKAWKKMREGGTKVPTFKFLGFTLYAGTTRNGYFALKMRTHKENFRRALLNVKVWLKGKFRNIPIKDSWVTLKAKMRGHYNYYGVSGNSKCIQSFNYRVVRMVFKWVNRRSQSRSMNWDEFNQYLKWYPLPKPQIQVKMY